MHPACYGAGHWICCMKVSIRLPQRDKYSWEAGSQSHSLVPYNTRHSMSTQHLLPSRPSKSTALMTEPSTTTSLHSALLYSSGKSATSGTDNDQPDEMPPHWENAYPNLRPCLQPVFYYAFRILCLMAMGRSTLRRIWHVVNMDDEFEYRKEKERLAVMIRTTNIVVGLFILSPLRAG
ncbi:hypothetical protein PENSPDRAFT_463559 [Peniophora sp. CONT]|nr:hypothetical protein PENSPDRAFT_463559 [Peniophora sp. CONT]